MKLFLKSSHTTELDKRELLRSVLMSKLQLDSELASEGKYDQKNSSMVGKKGLLVIFWNIAIIQLEIEKMSWLGMLR